MTSQQTSFRPGSKTDWRKCLASVPHCIDDPYPQDVLCEVKDKLTAVTDLLGFYNSLEFYNKPASFKIGTVDGTIRILDDCIDKLDSLYAKWG